MRFLILCLFCLITFFVSAQNSNTPWWKTYANMSIGKKSKSKANTKSSSKKTKMSKENEMKSQDVEKVESSASEESSYDSSQYDNVRENIPALKQEIDNENFLESYVETMTNPSETLPTILYYDSNWKGVSEKEFASFYRVVSGNDGFNFGKRFRDYYITGELQSEGEYVTIDKYDDAKSVFTGGFVTYYHDGKIESKGTRNNGVPEGEYTSYYENGLMKVHATYLEGKYNGIYTEFNEAGDMCMQIEYQEGEPKYDYYTLSNKDGYALKMKLQDNTPIWESPDISEKKTQYKEVAAWPYYVKNGLVVAISNSKVRDYGKYYRIPVVVTNHSLVSIDLDPSNIEAVLTDKKGRVIPLTVLTSEEYSRKIRNRQNWSKFFNGLAEGLAAAGAGYSTSTTNTNSSYTGFANSNYHASAIGSGGYAFGHGSSNSYWHGSSSINSTTVSYDGAAAYQASIIAGERTAAFNNNLDEKRKIREAGYLKKTTINPGETVSGYVNVELKKGVSLDILIHINEAVYKYTWNVENN